MNHPTIVLIQLIVSNAMQRVAHRMDIDTDDGFTTVEKVVLTGIAVLLAVGVGVAMRSKVADLLDKIDTSFE